MGVQTLKHKRSLEKLVKLQRQIGDINEIFRSYYPVAVVKDNCFYIYDMVADAGYDLVKKEHCPFPIPEGVRAAFPLESYDMKIAAVLSEDVFDSLEGLVSILHEFVHCSQFNGCEMELKEGLKIARTYRLENNYSWEIDHPFPYEDKDFIRLYGQYMEALDKKDLDKAKLRRMGLAKVLERIDFEYLLWQEWKEGLARYIENQIRVRLGLKGNHYGHEKPYHRVSFYESGSEYIGLIESYNKQAIDNKKLFFLMNQGQLMGIEYSPI